MVAVNPDHPAPTTATRVPTDRLYRGVVARVVWSPTPAYIERANVTRFMRVHGIATYEELVRRSVEDIAWFWDAVVQDLAIPWMEPYERVLDTSDGPEWARWFVGGRTNLAWVCVDRWAEATPDAVAVRWEGEDGATAAWTYAELRAETDRARPGAGGARRRRAERGRDLHADAAADRRRRDGLRQARRDLGPDLQRLRPRRRGGAARRRGGLGAGDGRRHATQRRGGADEGDRGRRGGLERIGRARGGPRPARGRARALDGGSRRALGGPVGRRGPAALGAARRRAPPVPRVHERDDGSPERGRPRARRFHREDRARGRVPGRPAPRRGPALGRPTSGGSWGRGRSWARSRSARPCCSTTARPRRPTRAGCGRSSRITA